MLLALVEGRVQVVTGVIGKLLVVGPHCRQAGCATGILVRAVKRQCCLVLGLHCNLVYLSGCRVAEPPLLSLFGAKGCGERVSFLPDGDFRWVIGNDVVLSKELVDSVPPKCERGLEAFDAVV